MKKDTSTDETKSGTRPAQLRRLKSYRFFKDLAAAIAQNPGPAELLRAVHKARDGTNGYGYDFVAAAAGEAAEQVIVDLGLADAPPVVDSSTEAHWLAAQLEEFADLLDERAGWQRERAEHVTADYNEDRAVERRAKARELRARAGTLAAESVGKGAVVA